ncbi:hypothetical protein ASPCAL02291 [Aspergillus calidoustus]|uniref:Uncharacterized protein n=1 Tax=Aspergillus calidoustus TaxID=454130 RepID=A0A0U5GK97_ASPCI|nr:hypothetical protein ASPCAL02291 [Aspergillus calidoustus]
MDSPEETQQVDSTTDNPLPAPLTVSGTDTIGIPQPVDPTSTTTDDVPSTGTTTTTITITDTDTQEPTATGTLEDPSTTDVEPTATGTTTTDTNTDTSSTSTSTSTSGSNNNPRTTEIPMIAAMFPNQAVLSDLGGSVSAVSAGETIIVLDCLPGVTSPCGGLAEPITITTGTSTFDYTAVYATASDGAEIVGCDITPLVQIDCTTSYTGHLSEDAAATAITATSEISQGGISYETITITAGIDLLPTETYVTTDYGWIIAYTGPAQPTDGPDPDSGSSKAWIAGPVVGGIVGLLLILGAIWFWMRRRKANGKRGAESNVETAELEGAFGVKDVSKLDVNKSELPVREHATAELSAEERAELSGEGPRERGRGELYELPP